MGFRGLHDHAVSRRSEHYADLSQRWVRHEPHLRAALHGKKPDSSWTWFRGDAGPGLVSAKRYRLGQSSRRGHSVSHHVRRIANRPYRGDGSYFPIAWMTMSARTT